ncbi:hypothetical protein [Pseudomonas fluorescens]|uniref:hypothetical protein n=1 Tax=Pseudomonas fluorescens TaxID=294 RepID=UPI00124163EA|nr:hypothetical protein [Pseudomonas fluorescens]VVM63595.1 hypothetical protein PS639_01398 [Pseudomonas fluorescens]
MTIKLTENDFANLVAVRPLIGTIQTGTLFDITHDDSDTSPIDQFIENTLRLNRMWVARQADEAIETELGILLILGYVSAVESFMRALLRRVVFIDPYCQKACEKAVLSYGAAKHQKQEMLPEALLEESVFSGKKGIVEGLKKFLTFELKDKALMELLNNYNSVCEIRHCCVHRFGKLGTKNAIELGLSDHKQFIEKPLKLKVSDAGSIADLLTTLVKSLNNEIFRFVLERTVTGNEITAGDGKGIGWTWNKAKDRKIYGRYYIIFASRLDATPTVTAGELYDRFRNIYSKVKRK